MSLDSDRDAAPTVAVRVTSDASVTSQIDVAQRDGALIVLCAGHASVRKAPGDVGAPPSVFE